MRLDEGKDGCRLAAEGAGGSKVREAPQSEQNFALAKLERPQVPHTLDSCAPHLAQKLLPLSTTALQIGQSIDAPRDGKIHVRRKSNITTKA
jgi:hypothetical protein